MSTISPNTKIAHYTIVSKIGAGGMGEVYLAEDTKLERKVALKILPADVAANQDRMRRLIRKQKQQRPSIIPTLHTSTKLVKPTV